LLWSDDDVENDPTRQVDDADEEDEGEREAKWRTERLEREKFLEEHKVILHGVNFSISFYCAMQSVCRMCAVTAKEPTADILAPHNRVITLVSCSKIIHPTT